MRIIIIAVGFSFLSCISYSQLPTLSGYHTDPIPVYSADQAYELISEWADLITPDLTTLPGERAEEIRRLLIMSEGDHVPMRTFDPQMEIWKSAGLGPIVYRLKHSRNLHFVEAALYKADALLARRNDTINGLILPTTGRREHTWYAKDSNEDISSLRLSYLNVGGIVRRIAELAQWILDHPELHGQEAPFNESIPIDTTIGNTYFDRAVYYLNELKKTFDLFEEEGGYWKLNPTNNVGFYFDNTLSGITRLNAYRDANPDEIPLDQFFAIREANDLYPYPYNRVLWFCEAHMRTAKALLTLDNLNGTDQYSGFYTTMLDRVQSVGNFLTTYAQLHQEASPLNNNYTWPYGSSEDHMTRYEDNTHVHMDFISLEYLLDEGLFDTSHARRLASSVFSRYFSYEHHVVYKNMNRDVSRDAIFNLPIHGADPYRPRGPIYGHIIGNHADLEQVQGFLHKSIELLQEGIREMKHPSLRTAYLERSDTRRTRWCIYPFEIFDLKMAYQDRISHVGTNHAPEFAEQEPLSVRQDVEAGSVITDLEATDSDEDQILNYWISKGNAGSRFKMNAATGEIYTNQEYPLNTDLESSYELEVFVTDNGNPVKQDSIHVRIDIEKTNSAPQIAPGQHYVASKRMVKGDLLAKVGVLDAENDSITKYLLTAKDDLFRIDASTGAISLINGDLTAYPDGTERTLYVQVQDNGSPSILSSIHEVRVTVMHPVLDVITSQRHGEAPFKVDFTCSPIGEDILMDYRWDFDNDGIVDTIGTSVTHTYDTPGVFMATVFGEDSSGLNHAERVKIRVNEGAIPNPSKLVAHYDFGGDGYVVHDISGNSYHANIRNMANDKNVWISGIENGAMYFSSESELEIPKEVFEPIVNSKSYSISFWLNDAQLSFHPIFQVYDEGKNHITDISSHLYAKQIIWTTHGNGFTEVARVKVEDNQELIRNGWAHWVFTKDAQMKQLKIYVNGEKHAQDWAYNQKVFTPEYIRLGALPEIGQNNMSFAIDEFRIYSKALSAEEVAHLFLNPTGNSEAPLSVEPSRDSLSLRVYPNPASDVLYIQMPEGDELHSIILFDLSGRILKTQQHTKERLNQMDLADLHEGIYVIQTATSKGTAISKIIKK